MKILAVFWVVLFFLFFAIYSTLSLRSYSNAVPLFNSPDETANYFFSKQFALNGALGYQEPLLKASNAYVHPRSMTAVGEQVVPGLQVPGVVDRQQRQPQQDRQRDHEGGGGKSLADGRRGRQMRYSHATVWGPGCIPVPPHAIQAREQGLHRRGTGSG